MFKDPDHKNEYTVSALGEFPLKEGKVYIQYKTSADMDLEVWKIYTFFKLKNLKMEFTN